MVVKYKILFTATGVSRRSHVRVGWYPETMLSAEVRQKFEATVRSEYPSASIWDMVRTGNKLPYVEGVGDGITG